MNGSSLRIALSLASAVMVPSVMIHGLTPRGRLDLGLGGAPFGWPIVMVVHLVASVPIGVITSAGLARSRCLEGRWAGKVVVILLGLAGPLAVGWWGEDAARTLESADAGFLARDAVRTVLAYFLVLPWLVVDPPVDGPSLRIPGSPAAVLVGATLAILPPLVYVNRVVEGRSIACNADLGSGRLIKAKAALVVLSELGSRGLVRGASPLQGLRGIEGMLVLMEREAARELAASAPSTARLDRAFLLIQLERLDEAKPMLRSLSEESPDALLLLGAVYRDQARWSDAERAYRRALASILPLASRDRGSWERLATAYDGLAEAARSGGHPKVAEQAYQEARRRLPERAGYFVFQLGRHYLSGGRTSEALTHLRLAVRLDPTLEAQVASLMRQARVKTPACLLRPSPG